MTMTTELPTPDAGELAELHPLEAAPEKPARKARAKKPVEVPAEAPPEDVDTPGQQLMELVWLPTALVAEHPRNVRDDYGDLTELAASIAAQGILEPLVVVADDDGFRLIAGHRRLAAAVLAGQERVPCILRPDLHAEEDDNAGQAAHVAAMLSENLHRRGLNAVEEARGVQQMLDLGVDLEHIAKATGLDQKQVTLAAGVARLETEVAASVAEANLTLEQAAAVALYADDLEVAAWLISKVEEGPGQFAHALTRAKKDREEAQAIAATRKELEDAGRVVVVDGELPDGMKSLHNLVDADGKGLDTDPEAHKACAGSAVYLTTRWNGVHQAEVCLDPKGNRHAERNWSGQTVAPAPQNDEEEAAAKEAAAAERRRVIENNKAMDAANTTRREWVREFLARKTTPKPVLRFAVETLGEHPTTMSRWLSGQSETPKDVVDGLGLQAPNLWSKSKQVTITNGEKVIDGRLGMQLFAHVAGAMESGIQRTSWRSVSPTDVRWLQFLASQGYTLAEVEEGMVAEHEANLAKRAAQAEKEAAREAEQQKELAAAVAEHGDPDEHIWEPGQRVKVTYKDGTSEVGVVQELEEDLDEPVVPIHFEGQVQSEYLDLDEVAVVEVQAAQTTSTDEEAAADQLEPSDIGENADSRVDED